MLSDSVKRMIFSRTIKMENGEFKVMGISQVTLAVPLAADWWMMFRSEKEREKLYRLGYEGGLHIMENFSKIIPKSLAKKLIKYAFQFTEFSGWGMFDLINFDVERGGIVHNKDSPVAKEIFKKYGKQKESVCDFIMGVSAGAFSYTIDKKVKAKETKCIACGDHVCEYDLKIVGD